MSNSKFVGVDGCRCGWFSVGFSGSHQYELKAFFSFDDLLDYYEAANLILVDMPIGLPDGSGERLCDKEARNRLRPYTSSVFRAPTRAAMKHLVDTPGDKPGAREAERGITRKFNPNNVKSLSEQTLAIMPKIAQIDELLPREETPYVREVHPEICFWALNGENPVRPNKHEKKGIENRICVLRRQEPQTKEIFEQGLARFVKNSIATEDDILDALVAAVTAYLGWPGQFLTLPAEPPRDERDLPMEMVYWRP